MEIESSSPQSKTRFVLLFSIISLIFTLATLFLSTYNYKLIMNTDPQPIYYHPGKPLPSKFLLDKRLLTPVLNQGDRGTCWIFQIIGVLEAQYKMKGLAKGYMKDDEHLRLSHQALGKLMVDKCMNDPKNPICEGSPRLFNTTTSGIFDEFHSFIKTWPDMLKSIVPESCCKYQLDPKRELECPDLYKCIKNNPLEFKFISLFMTTNIRDAKQRLLETQTPLALSVTMPIQRYFFPCDNALVKDSDACKDKSYKCRGSEGYCAPHDFKLDKARMNDFIHQRNGRIAAGTGHALLFVGYNDNFVAKRTANYTYSPTTIGGFIVKNSWEFSGHTVEYLYGDITEEQDAKLCPNRDDVFRWVPATYECMMKYRDVTKCSTNAVLVRGNDTIKHADILNCVNETHCDKNAKYVLLTDDEETLSPSFVWSSEGTPVARVMKLDSYGNPTIVNIESLPLQHLYYAFQLPKRYNNTPERCGYIIFTYDTIKDLSKASFGFGRTEFNVEGYQVEWSDSSYLGNKKRGKNYQYLKDSMINFKTLEVDTPFSKEL